MRVGFLIGVFDMFHIGHVRLLERAARQVDRLIVAVVCDEAVREQKGKDRPVYPLEDRMGIVRAIQGVSCVYVSSSFDPYYVFSCAWGDGERPTIFFRGDDQTHVSTSRVEAVFEVEVRTLCRTPGISTSETVKKLRGESCSS